MPGVCMQGEAGKKGFSAYKLSENHLYYWCSYQFSKSLSLILLWKFHLLNTLTSDCCLFTGPFRVSLKLRCCFLLSMYIYWTKQDKTKICSQNYCCWFERSIWMSESRGRSRKILHCPSLFIWVGEINEYYVFFKQYTLHCNFYC